MYVHTTPNLREFSKCLNRYVNLVGYPINKQREAPLLLVVPPFNNKEMLISVTNQLR